MMGATSEEGTAYPGKSTGFLWGSWGSIFSFLSSAL